MKNKKTLWIVVTGLDGSGKTTLVGDLQTWLTESGLEVKRDRFPHDQYLVKSLLNKSKDSYTDRLLFALDNRIAATEIKEAMDSEKYDIILTQRGLLDSFVHGAVQGFSYSFIEELNQISTLPKCDVMVHMVAEARIAYARIRDDPDADKFEYPAYMSKQEKETRRAYGELMDGDNPDLEHFKGCKNIYVDTTEMTPNEVFDYVKGKLSHILF